MPARPARMVISKFAGRRFSEQIVLIGAGASPAFESRKCISASRFPESRCRETEPWRQAAARIADLEQRVCKQSKRFRSWPPMIGGLLRFPGIDPADWSRRCQ